MKKIKSEFLRVKLGIRNTVKPTAAFVICTANIKYKRFYVLRREGKFRLIVKIK
jgi:hypothetical protein